MRLIGETRLRGALIVIGLLAAAMTMFGVWQAGTMSVLADGEPLSGSYKVAEPDSVPPGGIVRYTVVLSNSSGSAVGATAGDHLDSLLSFAGNVEVLPLGTGHEYIWSTPGYVTFTVYSIASQAVVTLSFDALLDVGASSGQVISNSVSITDGTHLLYTPVATFTVSQPPATQIYSPVNGAVITQREGTILTVEGHAWGDFNPAPFPGAPVLQPISNFGGGGDYNVEWTSVTDAAQYVLEEASNPDFTSSTTYAVAAPTTLKFIAGKAIGTYYYRVKAYNAQGRPSRLSNVEAVTVTTTSLAGFGAANLDASVAENAAVAAASVISVEVSTNNGASWHPAVVTENAGGWWDWSYGWTLPQGDNAQYPIKARAMYAGGGGYGEDTITVTIRNGTTYVFFPLIYRRYPPIPYPPVLSSTTPDTNGNYTLSWVYSHPEVPVTNGYTLQEATTSDFSGTVTNYDTTSTSKAFTNKTDGTYYYRVRGKNSYGDGDWSNTVTVIIHRNWIYEFNTAGNSEGWGVKRSDDAATEPTHFVVAQRSNCLYTYLYGRADWLLGSPLQSAPVLPYSIRGYVDIVNSENIDGTLYQAKSGMTYGIIFGANAGTPCPATRTTPDGQGCLEHYYRVLVAYDQGNGNFKWSLKRIDGHDPNNGGKGYGTTLRDWTAVQPPDALGWNEWKITVSDATSGNIRVYLNNVLIGTATDQTYIHEPYFGVFLASLDELGAVAVKWDWFRVEAQ